MIRMTARARRRFSAAGLRLSAALWLACLVFPSALRAASKPDEDAKSLKRTEIQSRIDELSKANDAGEESQKAIAAYRDALQFREDAEAAAAKAADFAKKTETAPSELEALTSHPPETPVVAVPDDAPLEAFVARAEAVKTALADARAALKKHTDDGKARAARQAALPGLVADANSDLAALPPPQAPLASGSSEEQAAYQRALAQRKLLERQVSSLQAEQAYLEATPALFSAEGGMLTRKGAALDANAADLQQRVDKLRVAVASDEVAKAREDLKRFADMPREREIAEEILDLAERHGGAGGLSERLAEATADVSELESRADRISSQFSGAKRRVKLLEEVGLRIDAATGRLLRSQRQALPSENDLRQRLQASVRLSAQAQIDQLVLEDRFADLLSQRAPASSAELERLWKSRLAGLRRLTDDHRAYIKLLRSTGTEIRTLLQVSSEFALFVDERLLWIPSTDPIGRDEVEIEKDAIAGVVTASAFAPLVEDLTREPWLWGLAGLFWIYLVARRRAFRATLRELGDAASKRNCTSFAPTALALLHSLLLAAPVPLVAWFVWSRSGDCPPAIGTGLRTIAGFLTATVFLRVLTQHDGLLTDHFRMEEPRVRLLRRNLGWLIPVMPPFLFLANALPEGSAAASAGRLCFIAVVVLLLVFFARLLRPAGNLVYWQGEPSRRFAKVWFVLGIAVPAILIVGAVIGYFASVQELRVQALMSVGLVLGTLFVAALLHRWILVSRRRLAVQQALKRRAAILAEREAREAEPGDKPQGVPSLEEVKANAVKVVEVEEQTTRLVRAAAIACVAFGLVGIWKTTIPALSALDRVTLWQEKVVVPGEQAAVVTPVSIAKSTTQAADEDAAPAAAPAVRVVTLQDLALAFIIVFLTIVAARNIPGLLELAVFRNLHLQPGSSFALTTSIRYLIVVMGIIFAFARIGIDWGKVQWIAAAITLGIGFGLQEIFANFVAGLIILFERPIRLGDIVTIAGVDGRVTQIRIRATTIRQFNNRELIVPNKEFITGQLVNWTLSDNILRVELAIGLAYGSDTYLARDLLLKAANENPRVLEDPPPVAVFDSIEASTLSFLLRAYVGGVEDLLPAKSEMYFAIDQSFRQAGIEIAFPQSDIHIRSLPMTKGTVVKMEVTES